MQAFVDARSYLELVGLILLITTVLTAVGLAIGYAAERRGPRIFAVAKKRGQLRTELVGTVLFHAVFVPALALALHVGAIRFEATGIAAALGSFGGPWIAFQVFYYFFHRALHHRALFFMHRWHHESLVTSPMTGFSMHPLEAVGWTIGILAPFAALSAVGALSFVGFALFVGNFWVGNVAGHANAELFPFRISRPMAASVPPVSYHALHHARFDGHYGFAAAYMDRLLGTEWPDWKPLHDRIYDGHALTSLKARGDEGNASAP